MSEGKDFEVILNKIKNNQKVSKTSYIVFFRTTRANTIYKKASNRIM